jgi:hypothetical protein
METCESNKHFKERTVNLAFSGGLAKERVHVKVARCTKLSMSAPTRYSSSRCSEVGSTLRPRCSDPELQDVTTLHNDHPRTTIRNAIQMYRRVFILSLENVLPFEPDMKTMFRNDHSNKRRVQVANSGRKHVLSTNQSENLKSRTKKVDLVVHLTQAALCTALLA